MLFPGIALQFFISRKYISAFFFLFLINANAQQTSSLVFRSYSASDGLSNSRVNCILKDSRGFIWIATENGLNRFDGTTFKIFKSIIGDSSSLQDNNVGTLALDADSNLWVASNSGLCKFDFKEQNFKRYKLQSAGKASSSEIGFTHFLLDSKKNFWITSYDDGLLKYDQMNDRVTEVSLPDLKRIYSINEDHSGNLWMIASHYDLFIYNPETKTLNQHPLLAYENGVTHRVQVNYVYINPSDINHAWIGTWGDGLLYLNTLTFTYEQFKLKQGTPHNLSNIVFQITNRDSTSLWVVYDNALEILNTNTNLLTPLQEVESSASSYPSFVHFVYTESKDRIWFSTGTGFSILDKSKQLFSFHDQNPNALPSELFYDSSRENFFGTSIYRNRRLFVFDKDFDLLESFPMPFLDQLNSEPFSAFSNKEGVWIGTSRSGIYFFDLTKKKFTPIAYPPDLDGKQKSSVNDIIEDSRGNLWFSCNTIGIIRHHPESKSFEHIPVITTSGDTIKQVLSKIIDLGGDSMALFFAEHGYGIFDRNTLKTKIFDKETLGFELLNSASDMVKSVDGRLFVITRNNGIIEVTGNKCVAYNSIGDEPINDVFYSGIADSLNNIWIASNNGFYRFNIPTKTFSSYASEYGLGLKGFGAELFQASGGKIVTLYGNGYYEFNPHDFTKEDSPPQLYFVSLKANGVSPAGSADVNFLSSIDLPYNQNNLTIEFAELNITNPGSFVFEYQLEGANKLWVVAGENHVVNYSALDPGHYIFKVRSKLNNGDVASNERSLQINIIPAWWQTFWFKSAMMILIITITYFLLRYISSLRYQKRIAVLERQSEIEKVRSRIARDIHDDIGAGITKITLMARNAAGTDKAHIQNNTVEKINSASKELIQQLGEIIWTVNPENDSVHNYFAFIRHYLNTQFDNTSINLKLEIQNETDESDTFLNPDIRRNSLLILKEAVNNAIKYARSKNISVQINFNNNFLTMEIADDGVGILMDKEMNTLKPDNKMISGNGLKNMQRRANEMNASLNISSEIGLGTKVKLEVPNIH